jgi:glycosyltransferase involved in cell wall biosynthesis
VAVDVPAAFRHKVRCIRHVQSQGGAAAKSTGVAEGRGEVFAFLDDDDLYDPDYLERALGVLDRHPEVGVLFMGVGWFGKGRDWGERTQAESMARLLSEARSQPLGGDTRSFGEELLPALLRRVPMPMQRPVVRRAALKRIGSYRADCLLWDCEWALRASMVARCAYLDVPLYRQRLDDQGTSSRADRELDHLKSGFDMTWRLSSSPPFPVPGKFRKLLRRAASDAALSIARYHASRGHAMPALRAWWLSQSTRPALLAGVRSLASVMRTLLQAPRSGNGRATH